MINVGFGQFEKTKQEIGSTYDNNSTVLSNYFGICVIYIVKSVSYKHLNLPPNYTL